MRFIIYREVAAVPKVQLVLELAAQQAGESLEELEETRAEVLVPSPQVVPAGQQTSALRSFDWFRHE